MSDQRITPTQSLEQSALDEAYREMVTASFRRLCGEARDSDKDDQTLRDEYKRDFDALVRAYSIAAGVMGA